MSFKRNEPDRQRRTNMVLSKVTKNSKRTFFGGSGSLIPMRRITPKPAKKNSGTTGSSSVSQDELDKIAQEAREQFGASPTKEEE